MVVSLSKDFVERERGKEEEVTEKWMREKGFVDLKFETEVFFSLSRSAVIQNAKF